MRTCIEGDVAIGISTQERLSVWQPSDSAHAVVLDELNQLLVLPADHSHI
jgi:hypothetical protein